MCLSASPTVAMNDPSRWGVNFVGHAPAQATSRKHSSISLPTLSLSRRSWIHGKPHESELLIKSEHEVDILKRNASLPFYKVVNGDDNHGAAIGGIHSHANVAHIAADHGLDGRRVADREDSQKWFACVSLDENIPNLRCGGWPRQLSVDRAQETASYREQMRYKGQPDVSTCSSFQYRYGLNSVLMRRNPVGCKVLIALRKVVYT